MKILSKIADTLICLTAILVIAGLIVTLYFSLIQWGINFKEALTTNQKMFQVGILIAIASGIIYFVEGYIHAFASSFKSLFRKEVKQ